RSPLSAQKLLAARGAQPRSPSRPALWWHSMSGLLEGKRILITGVLTDDSLAYGVADLAQREGAQIVLTGAGRGLSLTRRVAKHLPSPPDVLELDVTVPEHVDAVAAELR